MRREEVSESLLLNLPEDVHDEIFLKLPAESVLASRCVCKLFSNLLSKPNFIKNHVNRTNQIKRNPKLLCFSRSLIYSIPIDYASVSSSSSCVEAIRINYPFESHKTYRHSILGSCNGLVCLKIDSYYGAGNERRYFVNYSVLNPLTGEYKDFLRPPYHASEPRDRDCKVTYGFGYDNNLDDYKLVMISDFEKVGCFKIDVYAVKSDSWNRIQGTVNYSFFYTYEISGYNQIGAEGSYGVLSNGSLHWFGFLGSISTRVIICFHISNETIVDMPLPENMMPPIDFRQTKHMNVEVLGDCICMICVWGTFRTDFWVMQEYGVKESWIRKYSTIGVGGYWQPLWSFQNEEILVNNSWGELLLYDPMNDTVRSAEVQDIIMDEHRESYVESIVSLGSGTYMEKQIPHRTVKSP